MPGGEAGRRLVQAGAAAALARRFATGGWRAPLSPGLGKRLALLPHGLAPQPG